MAEDLIKKEDKMDLIEKLEDKKFINIYTNDAHYKRFKLNKEASVEETELIKASILEKLQKHFCNWDISVEKSNYDGNRIIMVNYKPILDAILQNSTYVQMRDAINKQSNQHIKKCVAYRGDGSCVEITIDYDQSIYGKELYQALKKYIDDIEYKEPHYSGGAWDGHICIKTPTGEQAEQERRRKRINELKEIFEEI